MGPLKIENDVLVESLRQSSPTLPDGHDFHIPIWKLARILETSIYNLAWNLKIANTKSPNEDKKDLQGYKDGLSEGIALGRAAAASDVTMDFIGILYSIKISGVFQCDWVKIKGLLNILSSKAGTGVDGVPKLDWGGEPIEAKKPENTTEFKKKEAK